MLPAVGRRSGLDAAPSNALVPAPAAAETEASTPVAPPPAALAAARAAAASRRLSAILSLIARSSSAEMVAGWDRSVQLVRTSAASCTSLVAVLTCSSLAEMASCDDGGTRENVQGPVFAGRGPEAGVWGTRKRAAGGGSEVARRTRFCVTVGSVRSTCSETSMSPRAGCTGTDMTTSCKCVHASTRIQVAKAQGYEWVRTLRAGGARAYTARVEGRRTCARLPVGGRVENAVRRGFLAHPHPVLAPALPRIAHRSEVPFRHVLLLGRPPQRRPCSSRSPRAGKHTPPWLVRAATASRLHERRCPVSSSSITSRAPSLPLSLSPSRAHAHERGMHAPAKR